MRPLVAGAVSAAVAVGRARWQAMTRERWSTIAALLLVMIGVLAVPRLMEPAAATPLPQTAPADQTQELTIGFDAALQTEEAAADGALITVSRSGPITAAQTFTFVWFSWLQTAGDAADLQIELRSGPDAAALGDWQAVPLSDDAAAPGVEAERRFTAPFSVARATVFELRISARRLDDGGVAAFSDVRATLFDTSAPLDPPQADLVEPRMPGRSNVRPPIVSRTAWGNPDGQFSPRVPAGWTTYYPTTHIVIHHTAGSDVDVNGSTVAVLRGIWNYHANTLGWGDVGYNYLIDRNGVIYEGRAGGDNVSGFHDAANEASMGIALIGTYTNQPPSAAAQQALVNLIAWKIEQRGLDPNGSAFYLGCQDLTRCVQVNPGAVVPVITTHRDIARTTSCPGDAFHALLAGIRQRVTQQLGTLLPEQLLIEENSSGFSRSPANWIASSCGSGGTALDTYATDRLAESTNIATWTPTLVRQGAYRVEVFIGPNCSPEQRTSDARYRIVHDGGASFVTVDQQNRSGWVELGTFPFAPGVAAVTLTDLNSEPYALRRRISFDAVRWTPAIEEMTLVDVRYPRTTVQVGELLEVQFTVRNTGTLPVSGQGPAAAVRTSDEATAFDLNGYVYNTDECFVRPSGAIYPEYPKRSGRFRVLLGGTDGVVCGGSDSAAAQYPWRWGIGPTMQPGETRTIVGYLRFTAAGTYTLRAGMNQEDRAVVARNAAPTRITVTADQTPPLAVMADALLQPQAQVLRLAAIPRNAVNRVSDARQIRTDGVLGRFGWDGETLRWPTGGPVRNADEQFVIQQTRVISVPVSGSYAFQLTTDDLGWLWVNGQLVTANLGLGDERSSNGLITLPAGRHVLAVKIVAYRGAAAAGYAVRLPGGSEFVPVVDGLVAADQSTANRIGSVFRRVDGIYVGADSLGGPRPTVQLLYGGTLWAEGGDGAASVSALADNTYELTVRPVRGSIVGDEAALRLTVNAGLEFYQLLLPSVER
jgi:hypothetical protein